MRTGVSLSRSTIAPHRHAQIVRIQFHHQPRIQKRLQPRANILFG